MSVVLIDGLKDTKEHSGQKTFVQFMRTGEPGKIAPGASHFGATRDCGHARAPAMRAVPFHPFSLPPGRSLDSPS
jgi:hypothetical protein